MNDDKPGPDVVKMYLNLPALERLLGGDSELEIALRHQIVNEFTKRHLTNLIHSDTLCQIRHEVTKEIDPVIKTEIEAQVGTRLYGIKGTIKQLITDTINRAIGEIIPQMVHAQVTERIKEWEDYINRKVKILLDIDIKARIEEEVKRRLAIVMNMHMQEG